jgi:hypothetical protein
LDPGDSEQLEVRQRRHGIAQNFAPNWFLKLLETHIAELQASHRQKLAQSSNPLNLEEARWEEEEKYQKAPWNGKQSGGKGLRKLEEENGRRQAADPGPGRRSAAIQGRRRRPGEREGGGE